jgi:hypothetical protein
MKNDYRDEAQVRKHPGCHGCASSSQARAEATEKRGGLGSKRAREDSTPSGRYDKYRRRKGTRGLRSARLRDKTLVPSRTGSQPNISVRECDT